MKYILGFVLLISIFSFQPIAEAYSFNYRPIRIQSVRIQPVYQYQQVNGYYRNNGTYVNPHIRGVSNSIKYDNVNYYYKNSNGLRFYPNR